MGWDGWGLTAGSEKGEAGGERVQLGRERGHVTARGRRIRAHNELVAQPVEVGLWMARLLKVVQLCVQQRREDAQRAGSVARRYQRGDGSPANPAGEANAVSNGRLAGIAALSLQDATGEGKQLIASPSAEVAEVDLVEALIIHVSVGSCFG